MNDALLALLRGADTPTVCNAIEVAQGRRGFAAFTHGTPVCSAPGLAMVGYAVTARLSAQKPPTEDPATIRARRMAYYRAMWEAPKPAIAVIEDLDPTPVGAFWGEVNTTLHKALGIAGALTNGVLRDLGDLPDGFPVVAGSIGPSHGFVHIREIGTPVTVLGLTVAPGDLIHADRHGAVVIPPAVIPRLAESMAKLRASEQVILAPSRQGFETFEAFEAAWTAFEQARV
ncbi:RraA family protein [Rubellimicrobium rubrum]|uniref:Putative 4-hydroxy-4-methyl-2-oxoglutarate aldolase n=1 Tax=Rubellimicrobium rubrum TaxID=2585369 RepID=A0A5C4N700_9RHOB|nr:RraA family protein [Rubellimicrobium rubrum]TNC52879.1 RraA family protein [Rubellimicrobium rubrum]